MLAAFGLAGQPTSLAGGQGTSWRVGDAVVKPLDMGLPALRWQANLLARLDGRDDFRVSRPLPTAGGALVHAGWTAWRYQAGRREVRRWLDVIEAGERLHAALRLEPEPPFLRGREDRWAIADRVAWDEASAADHANTDHVLALSTELRPIETRSQLIHGDLTGNVLFDGDLPPLIIDLSPYWRPPAFASAVVIADALAFEGAGAEIVEPLLVNPDFPQYLLRALICRIVSDELASGRGPADGPDPYLLAVELAVRLARRG